MYCKRCDRDDVGGFHRCFNALRTRNPIIALKNRPDVGKRLSSKLMLRIRKHPELRIDSGAYVKRLFPGYWQRSEGAWLWAVEENGIGEIGSSYTMKDCFDAKKWHLYSAHNSIEIIPDEA